MSRLVRISTLVVLALALAVAGLSCSGEAPAPTAAPTPAASAGPTAPSQALTGLEGKTVVLRWNGKLNGDKFLNRVAELLTQQVQDVKIVKMWEVDKSTAVISDGAEMIAEIVDKIVAQQPDLVIASQCD